jgi:hypothetical protein
MNDIAWRLEQIKVAHPLAPSQDAESTVCICTGLYIRTQDINSFLDEVGGEPRPSGVFIRFAQREEIRLENWRLSDWENVHSK